MKIVLDTNVLLSSISRKSIYRPIWDAFLIKKFQLVISVDIFFEYLEKLEEKTSVIVAQNISETITTSRSIVAIRYWLRWRIITVDPDDNKFFDVAIASQADYLVTNDAHFNVVKKIDFPYMKVVTANEFLEVLKLL